MSQLNDGFAETDNSSRIGYVSVLEGYMDIYVDLGSVTTVLGYALAPQGVRDVGAYNTPISFEVYGSNDATNWTLITNFSSITTGLPDWNPGDYRQFFF
jgi:hypothetical protein